MCLIYLPQLDTVGRPSIGSTATSKIEPSPRRTIYWTISAYDYLWDDCQLSLWNHCKDRTGAARDISHTHTHTRARARSAVRDISHKHTHTHTRARARAHARTHTHAHIHGCYADAEVPSRKRKGKNTTETKQQPPTLTPPKKSTRPAGQRRRVAQTH